MDALGAWPQRVALARGLITNPRALLLDEPFSALDAELRQGLREEFCRHIAAADVATLLVTRDEAEARAMHAARRAGAGGRAIAGLVVTISSQSWTQKITDVDITTLRKDPQLVYPRLETHDTSLSLNVDTLALESFERKTIQMRTEELQGKREIP